MSNIKKYTVKDFCKKYNETNLEQIKESLIKKVMSPNYVPYETKIAICEKIIETSYYLKDVNGNKKLHINSPFQYMGYCLWMVKQYTNIEIDFNNSLEEFNLLNESELLDIIYSNIPEKELKEFRMILDMVGNDIMQNEYETHAFISNQVNRFGELFGFIVKPAIEQLIKTIENMDEKNIEKMVDKLKGLNGLKSKLNIVK